MEEKKPHHYLLRKDVLGTYDAVAQSIALLAVLLGVALSSSSVAGAAGAAAPLVYLLAGLGCLCLTYIFIRFARLVASAGGIYAYIVRGLGPIAGFLGDGYMPGHGRSECPLFWGSLLTIFCPYWASSTSM